MKILICHNYYQNIRAASYGFFLWITRGLIVALENVYKNRETETLK